MRGCEYVAWAPESHPGFFCCVRLPPRRLALGRTQRSGTKRQGSKVWHSSRRGSTGINNVGAGLQMVKERKKGRRRCRRCGDVGGITGAPGPGGVETAEGIRFLPFLRHGILASGGMMPCDRACRGSLCGAPESGRRARLAGFGVSLS